MRLFKGGVKKWERSCFLEKNRIPFLFVLILSVGLLITACGSQEAEVENNGDVSDEAWAPSGQITIINGNDPGGPIDIMSRSIAEHLKRVTGQNVIVINMEGANHQLAYDAVTRSDPDGHTLLVTNLNTITQHELADNF